MKGKEIIMWLDNLKKDIGQPQHQALWHYAEAIDIVTEALSEDAVEVVRCKDCKHWHREIHNGIEYFNFNYCDLNHYGDGHNFYCADAERREP